VQGVRRKSPHKHSGRDQISFKHYRATVAIGLFNCLHLTTEVYRILLLLPYGLLNNLREYDVIQVHSHTNVSESFSFVCLYNRIASWRVFFSLF
jgi:hypothetical protein